MSDGLYPWVALLRGVNVGGKGRIGMADLRQALTNAGFAGVRTLIQSGNLAFRSRQTAPRDIVDQIGERIAAEFGFRPAIILMTPHELREIIEACPFDTAPEVALKTVHFYIAAEPPLEPDLETLRASAACGEQIALNGRVLYLHAPSGVGRSKLVPRIEKLVGVEMTGRNLNTMRKLLAMAEAA